MLPRSRLSRAVALLAVLGLTTLGLSAPVQGQVRPVDGEHVVAKAKPRQDPRRTQGLFVDPLMPAANEGAPYAKAIGSKAQAFWVIPEAYGTSGVRDSVRAYTSRALKARKTPMLTIYGIPGRDCGQYSSNNPLKTAAEYRAWIGQIAKGLVKQKAIVVIEPDALPLFSSPVTTCATKPSGWEGMLKFASKRLSKSGAWVYLDAGHSNWTPYDQRPAQLKQAGIQYARGFSTNVSNFRSTPDEKAYATTLLKRLRGLGIKGKRYVIDTSRNGAADPVDGQVINPTWARVGAKPRLVFKGAFDGTLWVKHPGESDGYENGGPASGQWCDLLADRLLGDEDSKAGC